MKDPEIGMSELMLRVSVGRIGRTNVAYRFTLFVKIDEFPEEDIDEDT